MNDISFKIVYLLVIVSSIIYSIYNRNNRVTSNILDNNLSLDINQSKYKKEVIYSKDKSIIILFIRINDS